MPVTLSKFLYTHVATSSHSCSRTLMVTETEWSAQCSLNTIHRARCSSAPHLVVDLSIDEHLRETVAHKQVVCDAVSQGGEVGDTVEESVLGEVINALLKDAGKKQERRPWSGKHRVRSPAAHAIHTVKRGEAP